MTVAKKNSRKRYLAALFGVLALSIVIIAAIVGIRLATMDSSQTSGHLGALEVGSKVPDFTLHPIEGDISYRFSQIPAKIVLVNFWASWCEACLVEMPSIAKLWSDYHSKGFEVLGINVEEGPEKILPRIRKRLGVEFPMVTDKEGVLSDLFDVHALPLTVILDKAGKVLWIEAGERDWNSQEIRQQLERWLAASTAQAS